MDDMRKIKILSGYTDFISINKAGEIYTNDDDESFYIFTKFTDKLKKLNDNNLIGISDIVNKVSLLDDGEVSEVNENYFVFKNEAGSINFAFSDIDMFGVSPQEIKRKMNMVLNDESYIGIENINPELMKKLIKGVSLFESEGMKISIKDGEIRFIIGDNTSCELNLLISNDAPEMAEFEGIIKLPFIDEWELRIFTEGYVLWKNDNFTILGKSEDPDDFF